MRQDLRHRTRQVTEKLGETWLYTGGSAPNSSSHYSSFPGHETNPERPGAARNVTRQEALLTTGLEQGPALKHGPKHKGGKFQASPSPLKSGQDVHTVTRFRYFYPFPDTTAFLYLITHQTWQAINQNNSKNETQKKKPKSFTTPLIFQQFSC